MVLTRGIPPAFRDGVHLFTSPTDIRSVPSLSGHITHWRTGGVYCRESADTGLLALEVVPLTGASFSGITMDQLMCASFVPHPLQVLVCSGHVMCATERMGGFNRLSYVASVLGGITLTSYPCSLVYLLINIIGDIFNCISFYDRSPPNLTKRCTSS